VLRGKGDGTFAPHVAFPAGHAPGDVAAVDLDHDGRVELIAASSGDAAISIVSSCR
jgi:hypothetical protein